MEEKIINMNQFLGAAQGDQEHMLGKFLYFSLANLLVDKDELSSLCESMGIPYTGSTRLSLGDAFRSATGDIRERDLLQSGIRRNGDPDDIALLLHQLEDSGHGRR